MAVMAKAQRTDRRTDALSKERIVEAAIEILDTDGESALTFRALAARLATGAGAIYWHVANKDELLAASHGRRHRPASSSTWPTRPNRGRRSEPLRLGCSTRSTRTRGWAPSSPANRGSRRCCRSSKASAANSTRLGVPERAQFDSATALVNYILGLAAQYAAGARLLPARRIDRRSSATVAARWTQHDPAQYPFVHQVAAQLREHDDRAQFLAGIDLILAGIATVK